MPLIAPLMRLLGGQDVALGLSVVSIIMKSLSVSGLFFVLDGDDYVVKDLELMYWIKDS